MADGEHYRRWAAGLCPCCGAELEPWPEMYGPGETQPAPVAEGVVFCGRCIQNQHMQYPGERVYFEAFLMALATRSDEPLERLFA